MLQLDKSIYELEKHKCTNLDLCLDILDGITGLDLEGDGLTREGFDEDLHLPF